MQTSAERPKDPKDRAGRRRGGELTQLAPGGPADGDSEVHGTRSASFAILGPLSASIGAADQTVTRLELGPFKQRVLLGMLLCRAGTVVSIDELTDALWWEGPPRTAHKNIQVYVSHLRRILPTSAIAFRPPGYLIAVEPDALDATRFERLARTGRSSLRERRPGDAARQLGASLRLWSGPALADLTAVPALRAEAHRWEERRLGVYEDWIEAEVGLGQHADVLDTIEALVAAHPLRERLRGLQMTALYRYGRQAEALAEYDNLRQGLATELGLQPTPALQRLYQAVLSGDPSLELDQVEPSEWENARGDVVVAEVVAHSSPPATVEEQAPTPDATGPEPPPPIPLALLPRDVDDFCGRERETAELTEVFDPRHCSNAGRLVAITGPPGVGKTALAIHAAHHLRAFFPDGAVHVSLRDGTSYLPRHTVLETVLDQLGSAGTGLPGNDQSRAALVRDRLSHRRVLLILDDAADESHVRSLLPGSGSTAVLVTSQRRLGGLESATHITLAPFDGEESRAFLGGVVGAKRVRNALAAADRIARACGGLPLALRIAGARLASRPHLSVDRFAARLDDSRLLDELIVGDLDLRAAVQRYVSELPSSERAALLQIGLLPDAPITVDRVAALLDVRPDAAEEVLENLVDVHAAVPIEGSTDELRCTVPNPLRLYARECALRELPEDVRMASLARVRDRLVSQQAATRDDEPATTEPDGAADEAHWLRCPPHRAVRPTPPSIGGAIGPAWR